jgi:neurofibromin 1
MVEGQQVERYQKDLDLVCLKAVVSLLDNLPLQPITAVRPSEIAGVKSKLFLRYFNHFRKLLLRYRRAEVKRKKKDKQCTELIDLCVKYI